MSLKQNKHAFFARNYSLKQRSNTKQIPVHQQAYMMLSQRSDANEIEGKQQTSAIKQLLQMKDQYKEDWKDKTLQNDQKAGKNKENIDLKKNLQKSGYFIDSEQKQQNKPQAQQIWIDSGLENIFVKKQSFDRLNHTQRKVGNQKTQDSQISLNTRNRKQILSQNNSYFMNRTNIWKSLGKVQKSNDLLKTQKYIKNLTTHDLYKISHQSTQTNRQARVDSYIDFYRSKSQFEKTKTNDKDIKKQIEPNKQQSRSIIILPNKSLTVRQMLQKIKSNQQIDLSNISNPQFKPPQRRFKSQRQPFQSVHTKQLQRKNFTPFKIEEQRKMQYSLQKLQQHIRKNPQLNDRIYDIDFKYLEKPTYCSWVQRNKDKIRIKKSHPLTVKPLKLLNP